MTVSIRPRRAEDDRRIVEIYNRTNPDRPPQTVDEFHHRLATIPPKARDTWLIAERDGDVVGYANVLLRIYTSETGSYWMQVRVEPGQERQGTGSALYERVDSYVRDSGGKTIYTEPRNDRPDTLTFLAHRGYAPTGHGDQLSRLDVPNAKLERSRVAAQRVEDDGIRIATLAEIGGDDRLLHRIWELDNTTSRDIPGQDDFTEMPYDEWYQFTINAPGIRPEIFWIALDGERVVGMCPLELRSPGYADNAYTAVDRSYRGRGIARALKLRTVEWAKQNAIRWIYTGNDVHNKPMLAINIDLGYQMLPANVELKKEL